MPSLRGGRGAGGAGRTAAPAALPWRGLAFGFALILCGLCGCAAASGDPPPSPTGAVPAGRSIGSASIDGRVAYEGAPPPRRPIKMSGEASCRRPGSEALSEDVIVGPDGGLGNVYVHVVSGLGDRVFAPPPGPALMDQKGCVFVPHVLDVQVNQVIVFANSDPVLHNVHTGGGKNRGFNISMSGKGRTVRRFFPAPEIIRIRCDLHAWMAAYIAVESHPFHRVTGDDGWYSLKGLPAGEYIVEAWHEKLGSRRQTVNLSDGESGRLDFIFGGRQAP